MGEDSVDDLEEQREDGEDGDDSSYASVEDTFTDYSDIYTSQSAEPDPTRCEFICGVAGSGKSYTVISRLQEDPSYALLTSSTGISSVNLNATTIHSALGFFDLDSLRDAYIRGSASKRLRDIVAEGYQNLVLDEISMVSCQMLDILVQIFDQVNETLKEGQKPIGLVLVGDFAQLPPIPERNSGVRRPAIPWAFDGTSWPRFEANTKKLTKIWRQDNPTFLEALNAARRGDGRACVDYLTSAGMEFQSSNDLNFDGTTILAENKHVDAFNLEALKKVRGRDMHLPTRRWGRESSEWKNIPHPEIKIRENAYVIIRANKPNGRGKFEYVNGEGGHVRGLTETGRGVPPLINVELVRTGEIVKVNPIVRSVSFRDKPTDFKSDEKVRESGAYYPRQHLNSGDKRYVVGQIHYYPLILGYASTAHRSQGLTLDRVQVDMRAWQFKNPGMGYISLSRCRSLEGLRIVGQPERVAAACVSDPRVARWL